jgi:hypothetical protein
MRDSQENEVLIRDQEVRNLQLQQALDIETKQVASLREQNNKLKSDMCKLQSSAEAEEEYISNTLLKRIDQLKIEKQELLVKLEAEEEMITNQLQKKLQQLQKEKIQMEITLEQEQEYMVNRLQKQLDDLRAPLTPRSRIPSATSLSRYFYVYLSASGSKWQSATSIDIPSAQSVVEMLKAEVWGNVNVEQ